MRLIRARTTRRPMQVDDRGLDFGEPFTGSFDVFMDDHRVWSYATDEHRSVRTMTWPKRLRRLLEGTADVRILAGDDLLFEGTVAFGSGEGRPQLRRPPRHPDLRRQVGPHPAAVRGTPRGRRRRRARRRHPPGADGDARRLRDRGLDLVRDPARRGPRRRGDRARLRHRPLLPQRARDARRDGRGALGDRARAAPGRDAGAAQVGQLRDGAVQGAGRRQRRPRHLHLLLRRRPPPRDRDGARDGAPRGDPAAARRCPSRATCCPAPADPDTMLEVSYGANWRVPDPSFRHLPGPDITERFDGWFGSLMKGRRDWTLVQHPARRGAAAARPTSPPWVAPQLEGVARVIEVGSGAGLDLAGVRRPAPPGARPRLRARPRVGRRRHRRRPRRRPGAPPRPHAAPQPRRPPRRAHDGRRPVAPPGPAGRGRPPPAGGADARRDASTSCASARWSCAAAAGLYLEGVARTPRDSHAWQARARDRPDEVPGPPPRGGGRSRRPGGVSSPAPVSTKPREPSGQVLPPRGA